jgi:hypothetical protein
MDPSLLNSFKTGEVSYIIDNEGAIRALEKLSSDSVILLLTTCVPKGNLQIHSINLEGFTDKIWTNCDHADPQILVLSKSREQLRLPYAMVAKKYELDLSIHFTKILQSCT